MGTIGTTSGYYQLSSLLSSGSGSSSASSATSLQALEQALFSSGSGTSSSSASPSYLLDLSPTAQSLLNGTSSGSGSSTSFTLTAAQKTAISNILAKYKDAPFTQATFDSIQNDLQAAGLSPQTLALQDQVKSFNPTSVLLSALSGNYSSVTTPQNSASSENTKESNYLQSIVSLWKESSSTASSASGASSSASISA